MVATLSKRQLQEIADSVMDIATPFHTDTGGFVMWPRKAGKSMAADMANTANVESLSDGITLTVTTKTVTVPDDSAGVSGNKATVVIMDEWGKIAEDTWRLRDEDFGRAIWAPKPEPKPERPAAWGSW